MAETFQDLFFSKERDRGAIPFKEYLMIKENMEKVVGNANYATKLIKEVFEQLPETKDFITCNPYVNSTTNSHLIPNYASKVLHNGTVNESIEIRLLDFDRNGYMNSLYINESTPTVNINTVFRKIKNGLDEKLSIGECNYDPDGISIIISKKDLIAPEIKE